MSSETHLLVNALIKSVPRLEFYFDDESRVIRRNLMVASTVAIVSTFVTPSMSGGAYEVNMIFLKGLVENPMLVYLLLLVVCLYYWVWFCLHCQGLTIYRYPTIIQEFFASVAVEKASADYEKLVAGFPDTEAPRRVGFRFHENQCGLYVCIGQSESLRSSSIEAKVAERLTSGGYTLDSSAGLGNISYTYKPKCADLVFLERYLFVYWLARKRYLFVTVLPSVYVVIAIVMLVCKLRLLVV